MNPELVDVKALISLDYDGRSYHRGEWFKARAVDALLLGEAGSVSLNREYRTRASVPAAPTPGKRGKGYKRRDMVAESS